MSGASDVHLVVLIHGLWGGFRMVHQFTDFWPLILAFPMQSAQDSC